MDILQNKLFVSAIDNIAEFAAATFFGYVVSEFIISIVGFLLF